MAAPTIRSSLIPAMFTNGSLTQSVNASTQVGDLVVFFIWAQGADNTTMTLTTQSGFFEWANHGHNDGTTDGRYAVVVKKVTVGGAQSYTPSTAANATANQITMGHIVLTAGTYQSDLDTVVPPQMAGPTTTTTNGAPDPGQVTGLTGDFLMLAIGCWHVTTAGSTQGTAGANYTIEIQNANASHVTHLAVARRTLTGLSGANENPATYTDNVTPNGAVSHTIAISGYREETITASIDAAVQQQGLTETASLDAVVRQTLVTFGNVTAVVQDTLSIDAGLDAHVITSGGSTETIETSLDAVVQAPQTVTASADAIVRDTRTATASADAAVQATSTITASLDAIVRDTRTLTAAIDAVIRDTPTVTAVLGAVVQATQTITAAIDAVVRDTLTVTAGLDAHVSDPGIPTISTSLDAVVRDTSTVTATIDAAVRDTATIAASLDAIVRSSPSVTAGLDAHVNQGSPTIAASLDAVVQAARTATVGLDAYISDGIIISSSLDSNPATVVVITNGSSVET